MQRSLKEARQSCDEALAESQERTRELQAAQDTVRGLEAERSNIARELLDFNTDLKIQRRECAKFETELEAMRHEQVTAELGRARQVSDLEADLTSTRQRLFSAQKEAKAAGIRCGELSNELASFESNLRDSVSEQRQKYKLQTRRLSAQIEYLKAKYTRENTFRTALALQKKFLLLLVGGMSLT